MPITTARRIITTRRIPTACARILRAPKRLYAVGHSRE
nr:MAG TPA: hypothetical protein [Caudoviricetes sp.]